MNRNALEKFEAEASALKLPENMVKEIIKRMEEGHPTITFTGQLPADRGQLDLTAHLKVSESSGLYFLNKFDVALSKAKPLEEGQKYMVITPNVEKSGSNLVRKFDSVIEAMTYFKDQKGTATLAVGNPNDFKFQQGLASMKAGRVDYVAKQFENTFYSPVLKNTHYVDNGRGFNVVQAGNMLQGRAAYRDDLVSRAGNQYKAWSIYQFNEPKDRYDNYKVKQFSEGYGFDLTKELSKYNIKEADQPKKMDLIIDQIKDGGRPLITVINSTGESMKLHVEAVPRYTNINFFRPDGKPEKREAFLKDQSQSRNKEKSFGVEKNKQRQKDQDAGLGI
ncbi:hypothetical protein OQY15_09655 [Pedobacter sp. MC2016-15]|uniref:hypothetical protein n=1 Tax=Pedobacter sp. MC2016-15 TaxID=2994473 RepID=UPI0022466304|nr:hypothetical protein [Pedobacter sp. MC2016-15]MCX2479354.1 hypothetical protein [Pedobacter sp. MC2016-15]